MHRNKKQAMGYREIVQYFTNHTVIPSDAETVRLALPDGTKYYWYVVLDGCTLKPLGGTRIVKNQSRWSWACRDGEPSVVIKLTAFGGGENGTNQSLGTALFRVRPTLTEASRYPGVYLRVPNIRGYGYSSKLKLELISVPKGVEIVEDNRFEEAVKQMFSRLPGMAHDLNQYAMISWQFPFRIPGWLGFRELGDPVPGWRAALRVLEWHGLSAFGFERWEDVTSNAARLDVFSAAVSVAAYSAGYDRECVDDRSKPWSSFGTGKDCDDFASQVCSLVRSIVGADNPPLGRTGDMWECAREYFDPEPLMVAGTAKPHFEKPDTIGHMWCEVRLKKELVLTDVDVYDIDGHKKRLRVHVLREGDRFPIECTCGVAFFGTELCGGGAGLNLR